MAGQHTTVTGAVIGDWSTVVLSNDIGVKVHQALAGDARRHRSHAVRGVTHGTGEAVIRNVVAVLQEAGVAHHVGQIMALGTHAVGAVESEVGIRKQVRH